MNEGLGYAIYWRDVVNDICVSEWRRLDWDGVPTVRGLREWMRRESEKGEVWEVEKLTRGGFDERLWNYGMRLQFLVPELSRKYLVVERGVEV